MLKQQREWGAGSFNCKGQIIGSLYKSMTGVNYFYKYIDRDIGGMLRTGPLV